MLISMVERPMIIIMKIGMVVVLARCDFRRCVIRLDAPASVQTWPKQAFGLG